MSSGAWFWLIVIFILTWGIPIALFLYKPKVDRSGDEVWPGIPYEHLKFNKTAEMLIVMVVSVGTSWLIWTAARTGMLVWK